MPKAISRPRKQRISGFFLPVFNLALGLFREEQCSVANFDEPRQKRGSHQICPMPIFFGKKMFFHVIITSTLLFYPLRFVYVLEKFFPLFAVSSNETILFCKFIRNTSVKKTATTKNQQNKTKAADWFYFSSITLRINLEFSIYLCLSYI